MISEWTKEKLHSIAASCMALEVSETGFHKWKRGLKKEKPWQILLVSIYEILDEFEENTNHGIERIQLALQQKGLIKSYSTVKRALMKGNLLHESRRNPDGLTKADKKAQRPENIIKQDFVAEQLCEKWLSDISQVPCKDGRLYISPMQDCYNGEIISLVMRDNMKRGLCIETVKEAYRNTGAGNGVIIHTDSGSQYTSAEYKEEIGLHHAIQSMSNVGKCYDNARMESWFATLKKEKLYQINTMELTMEEVKTIIWRYVNYYNRHRVTTVNPGGWPPVVYRLKTATRSKVA